MIIETVEKLSNSNMSAATIEIETGVDASSIRRIRWGERKLEKLNFDKGISLYEYAKSHLNK
jgi:hypothetical protein